MDSYTVKRLGLIMAIQAEIDGMKSENKRKELNDQVPTFLPIDFNNKALEIRDICNLHDHQL